MDQRTQGRCHERHCSRSLSSSVVSHRSPTTPLLAVEAPEPMQVGSQQLRAAERTQRRLNRLCFYCASPEHRLQNCPLKPGNGHAQ
ncbi:hypothetical protein FKM82_010572 [Ascaphus truei]